jgi:hypothetical protein
MKAMVKASRGLALAALMMGLGCGRLGRGGERPTDADQIRFSHATHARAKVDCVACHEEIYDAKTMEGRFLPPEAKCLECHKEQKEKGDCAFCHSDGAQPGTYPKVERTPRLSHAEHSERNSLNDCFVCHEPIVGVHEVRRDRLQR